MLCLRFAKIPLTRCYPKQQLSNSPSFALITWLLSLLPLPPAQIGIRPPLLLCLLYPTLTSYLGAATMMVHCP